MEWLKHSWRRLLEWEAPDGNQGVPFIGPSGHPDLIRMSQRELADLPFDVAPDCLRDCLRDCGPNPRNDRHRPHSG